MNPYSTDLMSDQVLGSAYQVVKYVAANMETLLFLSDSIPTLTTYMPDIQAVLAQMSVITNVNNNMAAVLNLNTNMAALLNINANMAAILAVPAALAAQDWKNSVVVATTGNITLTGAQTIDGVAVVAGNRVLVKNQTTGSQNGIYVVAAGAWTRATDAVSPNVSTNNAVLVDQGTANAGKMFRLSTVGTITVGTTAQVWEEPEFASGGGGGGAADSIDGVDTAGNSKYYGTDAGGVAGFHDLPAGGGGGGGEANTTSNAGTGEGLAKAKSGVNLPFKSLKAGSNITLTATADEIEIAASGGGGGLIVSNGNSLPVTVPGNSWCNTTVAINNVSTATSSYKPGANKWPDIFPLVVGAPITANLLAFKFGITGTVPLRMAIYSANPTTGLPHLLLWSGSKSVASSTDGDIAISPAVVFPAGLYWIAVHQGTGANFGSDIQASEAPSFGVHNVIYTDVALNDDPWPADITSMGLSADDYSTIPLITIQ